MFKIDLTTKLENFPSRSKISNEMYVIFHYIFKYPVPTSKKTQRFYYKVVILFWENMAT
jgi:hypothetical protein